MAPIVQISARVFAGASSSAFHEGTAACWRQDAICLERPTVRARPSSSTLTDTSHLKYLSINGLRTDPWKCSVCRRTPKEHQTSSWCAGYQNERKPGSLFDAVRAYLEHLKFIGELRDDMSDAERIDAVYVLYKQIRLAASLVGFVSFK